MEKGYHVSMKDAGNAVEIEGLKTAFTTEEGVIRSVDGVSFCVPMGKTVCLVGESGCGKSVTGLSLMRLLPGNRGRITAGAIRLNLGDSAIDLTKAPEKIMQSLRGGVISMIFQEPMTALNPVLTVGNQIGEAVRLHGDRRDIQGQTLRLLERVGIPDPQRVAKLHPHNLSGGMRQRVCIAIALAGSPRLIIADEPTTALDVTVQAQILNLIRELQKELKMTVVYITHDLGVVAQMAQQVVVMYAGRVVEAGTVEDIFYRAAHPYTRGLLASQPVIGRKDKILYAIPGTVPNPRNLPHMCYFRDRCEGRGPDCEGIYPEEIAISDTHRVSCYFPHRKDGEA